MFRNLLLLAAGLVLQARAQDETSASATSTTSSASARQTNNLPSVSISGSVNSAPSIALPSGSYIIPDSQVAGVTTLNLDSTTRTITVSASETSSTSNDLLIIGGGDSSTITTTTTTRSSATSTTTSATPTNTQPCNNYPEFCSRQYSNITQVAAHNAAFSRVNNVFSNQQVPILGQLNDGIRMIQGEVHHENNTLYNCHSSCSLLNTGPYEETLRTISRWLDTHPYDVITLLIVNSNYAPVTAFEPAFESSGILNHIYLPSRRPMRLDDWPTLEDMILSDSRVVVFMDYEADPDTVPYIMDEFSNMWETPFSPTNPKFPCTQQRPPGLSEDKARNQYLYMANHNLNVELSLMGQEVLIPNFSNLELVNADNFSTGALRTAGANCTSMWGRPPNFLLVDFYDVGEGSVFEVAARLNNVTYTGNCCGGSLNVNAAKRLLGKVRWEVMGMAMAGVLAVVAFKL